MRVLVTRPGGDCETTAARLRDIGHEPVLEPLLNIVFLDIPKLQFDGAQALAVTSANGVRALATKDLPDEVKAIPLMAIGEASASEACGLGFSNVIIGGGTLPLLAADIVDRFEPANGRIVYLAGRARSGDLAGLLAKAGFSTETLTLYEAERATAFSLETARSIREGAIDGVVLFSARTASIYAALIRAGNLGGMAQSITCYCLSQQVASTLDPKICNPANIQIATAPTLDGLLASIEENTK